MSPPTPRAKNHLRIWDLDPDKTTNFKTQNCKEPTKDSCRRSRGGIVKHLNGSEKKRQHKVRDIMETISKLKWKGAGHVVRRTDNWCTKRSIFWTPRGLFLESPETFRAHFGWHNCLCIFKTKASRGTKLSSYFYFYSLYNIWKDQLYKIS